MLGGRSKDSGYFNCYDIRIVNGAQTAGSIAAAFDRKPEAVNKARVHVRFIAVGGEAPTSLGIPSQKPPTLKTVSTGRTSLHSIPNSNACAPN